MAQAPGERRRTEWRKSEKAEGSRLRDLALGLSPSAFWPVLLKRLGSGGLLGEQLHRVEQLAVHQDFVVQVSAGRATGRADVADDIATVYGLACLLYTSPSPR